MTKTFKDGLLQTTFLPQFLTFDPSTHEFTWITPTYSDVGQWKVELTLTATGTSSTVFNTWNIVVLAPHT